MAYLAVQDEILRLDYGTYVDAQWGVLHEWGHNRRVLPVLAEAIDLLKSHPTPTEYGWGSSLLNAASIVGHAM